MRGYNCLQHTKDVLWVQLRPNANVWSCWQWQNACNSLTFTHLPVRTSITWLFGEMHVCACVHGHAHVLLGFTEQVLWSCQSRGYSPASGEGSGAQILHYGLIHHLWDSLAALSIPVAPHPLPLPLTPFLTPFCRCTGPSLISHTPVSSSPSTSVVVPPLTLCLIQFLISTPPTLPPIIFH